MTGLLGLRLDLAARMAVPAALAMILALISAVPLTTIDIQVLKPLLPLGAIYYWALYRPDLLPAPIAFVVGLLVDILGGTPLGVHAAAFPLAHGVLCAQRRFLAGKSFAINWSGFACVATGVFALVWLLTSLLHGAPVGAGRLVFQAGTTIAIFPLLFWLLLRCHRALVRRLPR